MSVLSITVHDNGNTTASIQNVPDNILQGTGRYGNNSTCCNNHADCNIRHECSVCCRLMTKQMEHAVISYAGAGFCERHAAGRCVDYKIYETLGYVSLPCPTLLPLGPPFQRSFMIAATVEFDSDCRSNNVSLSILKFNLMSMAFGTGKGKRVDVAEDVMRIIFDKLVEGTNKDLEKNDPHISYAQEKYKTGETIYRRLYIQNNQFKFSTCKSDIPICLDCKAPAPHPTNFHYLGQYYGSRNPGLSLCDRCTPIARQAIQDDMVLAHPELSIFQSLSKLVPVRVSQANMPDRVIMDPKFGYNYMLGRIDVRPLRLTEWIIGVHMLIRRNVEIERKLGQRQAEKKNQLALLLKQ